MIQQLLARRTTPSYELDAASTTTRKIKFNAATFHDVNATDGTIRELVKCYYKNVYDRDGHRIQKLPSGIQAMGKWNVSNVKDMSGLFSGLTFFNEDIGNWDVSSVENMKFMFRDCTRFDKPIGKWDVSKVRNMSFMFSECKDFRGFYESGTSPNPGNIGNWNVSNVIDMVAMFSGCENFVGDVDNWKDVRNVKNMFGMFDRCSMFTGVHIGKWYVRNVTNMVGMFIDCKVFDGDVDKWVVSSVTDMSYMFHGCMNFNKDISNWDVGNVTDMQNMFCGCTRFTFGSTLRTPIEVKWDVRNVTNMAGMFCDCYNLSNVNINIWDVSNVTDMSDMFHGIIFFNENISQWTVNKVTNWEDMFYYCFHMNEERKPPRFRVGQRANINIHHAAGRVDHNILLAFFAKHLNVPDYKTYIDSTISEIPKKIVDGQPQTDYGKYIIDTLNRIISEIPTNDNIEKHNINTLKELLERLSKRLNGIGYHHCLYLTELIVPTLTYVTAQPLLFKDVYVNVFIKDCVKAYPENINNPKQDIMTCAHGALERIYMSLSPSAIAMITTTSNDANDENYELSPSDIVITFTSNDTEPEVNEDTIPESQKLVPESQKLVPEWQKLVPEWQKLVPEWQNLVDILEANPPKMIHEYIIKWYKDNSTDNFRENTVVKQRRGILNTYLLEKYPNMGDLIEEMIQKYADTIGYDNDIFTYDDIKLGGRRRRRRKTHRKAVFTSRKTKSKLKSYVRLTRKRRPWSKSPTRKSRVKLTKTNT
jgi:surface protein